MWEVGVDVLPCNDCILQSLRHVKKQLNISSIKALNPDNSLSMWDTHKAYHAFRMFYSSMLHRPANLIDSGTRCCNKALKPVTETHLVCVCYHVFPSKQQIDAGQQEELWRHTWLPSIMFTKAIEHLLHEYEWKAEWAA